ncbi:hypothetical protein BHE74_00055632, partial [Ensete ventricosum]
MTGAIELQLDDGPRSSFSIEPGSDDAVGSHRSSLGDSPKDRKARWEQARRSPKEDQKTHRKKARGYQIGGSEVDYRRGKGVILL